MVTFERITYGGMLTDELILDSIHEQAPSEAKYYRFLVKENEDGSTTVYVNYYPQLVSNSYKLDFEAHLKRKQSA